MIETRFKDTEIGLIPEDWEVKRLGDVFDILRNNTLSRDCLNYSDGDCYNVHYGDVLINLPEYTDVSVERLPLINRDCSFSKSFLQDGDVVMADTAEDETAGKVTEILGVGENKVVSGLHTIPLRPRQQFAPKWLGYSMNSSLYHNQLLPLLCGTKVSSVSKTSIVETKIAFPKEIKEQKAIASALSDVDGLLRELGELIAKKKAIKMGMMQELLTVEAVPGKEGAFRPKRRLKGFEGDWVEKRLGEIGVTFNGLTGKSAADFGTGKSRYITFLNVLNNPVIDLSILEKVDVKVGEKQNAVKRNDLLFNTSSETPEEVGICSVLLDDVVDVYLNSFCFGYRLTDDEVLGLYLAYFFRCKDGRNLMTTLAQGSTRYNLSKDSFLKSLVVMPSTKKEQTAIAEVLSDMDAEIAALEAKRAKYEQVKNGMMQELLTGKIRLV